MNALAALLLFAPPIHADVTGDGIADLLTEHRDGGSGYSTIQYCVADGATGATACYTEHLTAYSFFAAEDRTTTHAPGAALTAALPHRPCAAPSRGATSQAAMWLLAAKPYSARAPVRWSPGAPRAQVAVCLKARQAAALRSAFAWDPSGTATSTPMTIRYLPGIQRTHLQTPRYSVHTQGAAIAIYDRANHRHAWLANYGDGDEEGFKVDRWQRITGVTLTPTGFQFAVRRAGAPSEVVQVPVN